MRDQPFALVGINGIRHTPESLTKVMTKEQLDWRSFADDGTILRQWNAPMTPAFYVIDHKGVIRRKWIGHPGEASIDAALDKLIAEATKPDRK